MVQLGIANSRMKDFFDIYELAAGRAFDGDTLRRAVAATFARQGIEIPTQRPLALTEAFCESREAGAVGTVRQAHASAGPSATGPGH